jgi:hypothetical protein
VGGKHGAKTGTSIAASGTRYNYLNEAKKILRIEIIKWEGNLFTLDYPHVAARVIYEDGEKIEIHSGNYSKTNSRKGPGVILQANSSKFIDGEIAAGRAVIYDSIIRQEDIKKIRTNINSLMREQGKRYTGSEISDANKGGIRGDVINRYDKGDIEGVYKGGDNKHGKYDLGKVDCYEFIKDVAGEYSKIGITNRFSFFCLNESNKNE